MATDQLNQTGSSEYAPAKINLCLHVTGRRSDGYHLLDSLVVFADVGDRLTARPADGLSLRIIGPEAAGLAADDDNLVLQAARAIGARDLALTLDKRLPVASGIGGGSTDAAAALRLIARMTGLPLPDAAAVLRLGADVPVCMAGRPVRMRGVGEELSPLPPMPTVWLVLVNPRLPVPTPLVFAALDRRENPPVPDLSSAALASVSALADWLSVKTRNDLAPAALRIAPVLAEVQTALERQVGCHLARMSGSGGTHFGLFASQEAAEAAARTLSAARPDWWIACAPLQFPAVATS
ncbi:MAG TPA: 4-(cytidine 5'-diphospho)-2-C-methyl-D-erythritol kinase [Tabrizicola sp.]|nr:4-(cytidine 5'-diphospho)-2-C-methyl-D-erythritol kinase [Tabrizicola sp.]